MKIKKKRARLGNKMRYFKIPFCWNFVWKNRDYSTSQDTRLWCLRSKNRIQ